MEVGLGHVATFLILVGSGHTPLREIRCPKYCRVLNHQDPESVSSVKSILGRGYASFLVTLLSLR